MESSPLRPSLVDQCLSSPSPTTTIAHNKTSCFSNEFLQPHDQLTSNASIQNMARKSCKRRVKQKKNSDDEENRKRIMENCKGELGESRGYIHVRARRGEATDSHSLAERVRREKISEKMKTLQAIVPGCDKITGKAHMLDEVINYVHFLQNEVQILSLKLASVNPMLYELEADLDAFMHQSHQNTSNYQEQLLLFQEHQMPCIISQNNAEILLDSGEQRQEFEDPLAILNSFNSF